MMKALKAMLAAVAVAFVFGFASVQSASATPVTYTTTGTFGPPTPTPPNSVTSGGITITFTGVSRTVDAPTNDTLGNFAVSGSGTGNFSIPFTLTVTQTQPTPGGNGTFSATLSGTITANSSNAFVQFTNNTLTIDSVTYVIFLDSANRLFLPAPNGQNASIQVQITAVPEPATMLLFGTGLAGLAGAARRRMKREE